MLSGETAFPPVIHRATCADSQDMHRESEHKASSSASVDQASEALEQLVGVCRLRGRAWSRARIGFAVYKAYGELGATDVDSEADHARSDRCR